MPTIYETLVQKAVAKGVDPDLAAAAAEEKLAKEGRSLMEMAPGAAPAAAPVRSALVQKAVSKGVDPELAAVAAEQKIEREAQKAFAAAPAFSTGMRRAATVEMAEPGARDVVAEVLGPRRADLPEIGTKEAEAVYAMPSARAASPPAAPPRVAPPAPSAPTGMVPMSDLTAEQRIDVERARREESVMRAREAQRQGQQLGAVLAPYVGGATLAATGSPVAASTASFLPGLLGYASYGAERAFGSDEPGVMEMMVRDRTPVRTAPRTEGAFGLPPLSFEAAPSAPMPEQTLEEQAQARLRTATSGESALGEAISGAGREVMAAGREFVRPFVAAGEAVTEAGKAYRAFQERNRPARPLGYVNPYEGMTPEQIALTQAKAVNIPTQQNVMRRENALLAESDPRQYVPVGPPDDPYRHLAQSPEDALLAAPAAFDRWATLFPKEAEDVRRSVAAKRDAQVKVVLPGTSKPFTIATVAEIARSRAPVEGVSQHVLATLAEGDPLANARELANNPTSFFKRSTEKALSMGILPPAEQIGLTAEEYALMARDLGEPSGEYPDGSLVIGEFNALSVQEALALREKSPSEFLQVIGAVPAAPAP